MRNCVELLAVALSTHLEQLLKVLNRVERPRTIRKFEVDLIEPLPKQTFEGYLGSLRAATTDRGMKVGRTPALIAYCDPSTNYGNNLSALLIHATIEGPVSSGKLWCNQRSNAYFNADHSST